MNLHPDLDVCRRFLAANPPPGRPLVVSVTGSHNYGFPSADSDLDIKGVHLAPTRELLGLGRPKEAHDRLEIFEGVECDLTTNEVGRFLTLLLKGNGNMLERVFSPYQLFEGPELPRLRELAHGSLSKACFGHYAGYFKGMQVEHRREAQPRAKSLLYTYRVALTGVHLLRTGEVDANLLRNAERYGLEEAEELVQLKRHGDEKGAITPEQDARFCAVWDRLEAQLQEAKAESALPEKPQNRAEVDAWLVELRATELTGAA